ncbi:hypothetical protein CRV24_004362 [Beauveria bassiana]|nr:hypothetical protein CRV24_004362 [Beauveria bassiana]
MIECYEKSTGANAKMDETQGGMAYYYKHTTVSVRQETDHESAKRQVMSPNVGWGNLIGKLLHYGGVSGSR